MSKIKHQWGGKRPNSGRKALYDWKFLLSVQKEISILRKNQPGTTVKRALDTLAKNGKLPYVDILKLAKHIEKRRRLIRSDGLHPTVDLLSKDFSFDAGIPSAIKDLP